jgi:hypothetical protein
LLSVGFAWVYVLFAAIALYMEKYINVFTVIYTMYCTVVLHSMCKFFIESSPDTQRKERQGGEREIWVIVFEAAAVDLEDGL